MLFYGLKLWILIGFAISRINYGFSFSQNLIKNKPTLKFSFCGVNAKFLTSHPHIYIRIFHFGGFLNYFFSLISIAKIHEENRFKTLYAENETLEMSKTHITMTRREKNKWGFFQCAKRCFNKLVLSKFFHMKSSFIRVFSLFHLFFFLNSTHCLQRFRTLDTLTIQIYFQNFVGENQQKSQVPFSHC